MEKQKVSINAIVKAPLDKVWEYWTKPEHIKKWNHASEEWHSPAAENDLRKGGKFSYRMEAKDGSSGFDFYGTYTEVNPREHLAYTMGDGRKVELFFNQQGEFTHVTENFEAESENSVEMQKTGWQAILNNFKSYVEQH